MGLNLSITWRDWCDWLKVRWIGGSDRKKRKFVDQELKYFLSEEKRVKWFF